MSPMNHRLLRPLASGGFDPRRIAGLTVWYDTLTPSSYTEASGQISEWRSKVDGTAVSQGTANNRPTLFESSSDVQGATRSEINGRQAFYFDGTNDRLASTAVYTGAQWTAFGVGKPQSVSGARGVLSRDPGLPAGAPPRGPQYLRHDGGTSQTLGFATGGAYVATAASVTNNTPVILSALQTATQIRAFVNNTGGTAVNGVQQASSTELNVGSATPTGNFWLGAIGEVLLWERALSATEQQAVYDYLKARWGL
jgi:hypothetical protein